MFSQVSKGGAGGNAGGNGKKGGQGSGKGKDKGNNRQVRSGKQPIRESREDNETDENVESVRQQVSGLNLAPNLKQDWQNKPNTIVDSGKRFIAVVDQDTKRVPPPGFGAVSTPAAVSTTNPEPMTSQQFAQTTLLVRNIEDHVSEDQLSKFFSQAGKLKSVRIDTSSESQGYVWGYVKFERAKDAAHAMRAFNGESEPAICGSRQFDIRFKGALLREIQQGQPQAGSAQSSAESTMQQPEVPTSIVKIGNIDPNWSTIGVTKMINDAAKLAFWPKPVVLLKPSGEDKCSTIINFAKATVAEDAVARIRNSDLSISASFLPENQDMPPPRPKQGRIHLDKVAPDWTEGDVVQAVKSAMSSGTRGQLITAHQIVSRIDGTNSFVLVFRSTEATAAAYLAINNKTLDGPTKLKATMLAESNTSR